MSYRGYTTEQKIAVIHAFHQRTESVDDFCDRWGIRGTTLREWMERYERHGSKALTKATQWKRYSPERKQEAVEAYLNDGISQRDIIHIYGISSRSVLQRWIMQYHEGTLSTKRGGSPMTNARSTTWQERITIVQDCLAQQNDYSRVAEQHQVSYNQVYRWVRKYEQGGWEALEDRRGRSRQSKALTNEEQAEQEKRRIEKENEQLRMENAFLKKLRDIERRDR